MALDEQSTLRLDRSNQVAGCRHFVCQRIEPAYQPLQEAVTGAWASATQPSALRTTLTVPRSPWYMYGAGMTDW